MKREIATIALSATLALGGSTALAGRRGEDHPKQMTPCNRWAYLVATSDHPYDRYEFDYIMHQRGCTQDYVLGSWSMEHTRCMVIAYRLAVDGLRGRTLFVTVGGHGCVLYEDGSWGNE